MIGVQPIRACRRQAFVRFIRLAAAASLLLALVALPAARVVACSCAMSTPEEAAIGSDAVFTGTVVGTSPIAVPPAGGLPGTGDTIYTFAVDGVAKGDLGPEVSVLAGGDGTSCGIGFAADVRYLVFASIDGAGLTTHLCSGSTELPVGQAAPLPMRAPAATVSTGGPPLAVIVLGAVVLGLAGISTFAFRRGR
jgi:hypothetical protein